MIALLVAISILPAIVLLWYFDKQDKGDREPRKLIWKIFAWGIMATIFAIVIELIADGFFLKFIDPVRDFYLYIFISSFIVAAFVEESLKLWVVKEHVFRSKYFNEIMDGITYTIVASLGFATLENILYVLEGGIFIAIMRALLSVPAHALFSGIMGFYIGKSRFEENKKKSQKLLFKGLLLAVLYHGTFDFLLFTESTSSFLVIPLLIVMGLHLKNKINQARFEDKVDGQKKPQPLTWKSVAKVLIASILIFAGLTSILISIFLALEGESGFGQDEIVTSFIFALILFTISYFILHKKKPNHPQSSYGNTT